MTTLVRKDALPEGVDYPDEGCDVAPSCFTCPLPVCKFDYPGVMGSYAKRWFHRDIRAEAIRRDRAAGMMVEDIARRHGVSLRTVERAIHDAPEENPIPEITLLSMRDRFRPSWVVPTLRLRRRGENDA